MGPDHATAAGKEDKVIQREPSKKVEETYDSMEEDDFMSSATDQEENTRSAKKKNNNSYNMSASSGSSGKKGTNGGGGGGGGSMKCCQAEKCAADLGDAKQYHRRHKVCEYHAKAQMVVVGGIRQRFCQQCSRFHELSEFDETKRSCRRRLAGHNERRRKNSIDSPYHSEGSSSTTRKGIAAEGGGGGGGGNGGTHQMSEMICGQVEDRGRIPILNIQENASYKHFQIR